MNAQKIVNLVFIEDLKDDLRTNQGTVGAFIENNLQYCSEQIIVIFDKDLEVHINIYLEDNFFLSEQPLLMRPTSQIFSKLTLTLEVISHLEALITDCFNYSYSRQLKYMNSPDFQKSKVNNSMHFKTLKCFGILDINETSKMKWLNKTLFNLNDKQDQIMLESPLFKEILFYN